MGSVPPLEALIALVLGLACARAPGIAGCEPLAGNAREDCRFEEARKVAAEPGALDAALRSVDDPLARDLLLVRLAFDTPASSARFCARVTTAVGKQRCQQIIGRPHLRGGP